MRTLLITLVAAVTTFGCVGKSKYNALNEELASCKQTLDTTEAEKKAMEDKLSATQAEQQALFAQKQQLEGKTKEYEEMVGSLQKEVDSGNVKISQMQDRLTVNLVDRVLFDSGSVKVKKGGEEALAKIADVINNYKDKRVLVEGHTDNVPVGGALKNRFPTNWELSAARATTVARFLVDKGVSPERLAAMGFGEYRPISPNDTPEDRSKNRRIEISLLKLQLEKTPIAPETKSEPTTDTKTEPTTETK